MQNFASPDRQKSGVVTVDKVGSAIGSVAKARPNVTRRWSVTLGLFLLLVLYPPAKLQKLYEYTLVFYAAHLAVGISALISVLGQLQHWFPPSVRVEGPITSRQAQLLGLPPSAVRAAVPQPAQAGAGGSLGSVATPEQDLDRDAVTMLRRRPSPFHSFAAVRPQLVQGYGTPDASTAAAMTSTSVSSPSGQFGYTSSYQSPPRTQNTTPRRGVLRSGGAGSALPMSPMQFHALSPQRNRALNGDMIVDEQSLRDFIGQYQRTAPGSASGMQAGRNTGDSFAGLGSPTKNLSFSGAMSDGLNYPQQQQQQQPQNMSGYMSPQHSQQQAQAREQMMAENWSPLSPHHQQQSQQQQQSGGGDLFGYAASTNANSGAGTASGAGMSSAQYLNSINNTNLSGLGMNNNLSMSMSLGFDPVMMDSSMLAMGAMGGAGTAGDVNVPLYSTCYREGKAAVSTTGKRGLEDDWTDIQNSEAAQKLYLELGIHVRIDKWEGSMRRWLSATIVKPIANAFAESEKLFEMVAADILKSQKDVLSRREHEILSSKNKAQIEELLMGKYNQHPFTEKRKQIQKFITVGDSGAGVGSSVSTKAYVLHRINELAMEGDFLASFKWSGGGEWAGKQWGPHLPTDSQLLMHGFFAYLDELDPLFSRGHFRDAADRDSKQQLPQQLTIVQTKLPPAAPYYLLTHREAKQEWRPEPGRSNLFHVLCLFVFYVKKHLKGRVGMLSLTDKSLNHLASIVS